MNLTRAIGDYLDALSNAKLAFQSPSVFLPFAAFALVQCVLLFALASLTNESIAPVVVPVLRALGGEESLHYPAHLVLLPVIYQRVYLPLVVVVGFPLWALAVWMMVDRHAVGQLGARPAYLRALPHVLVVAILFVGLSAGIGWLAGQAAARVPVSLAIRGLVIAGILLTVVVQTLLVYAPLALRVRGVAAPEAIRSSVRYARRHFLATGLVVATILLAHVPVDFLLVQAQRVPLRFHPENTFHLLVAGAILEMFTAYVLFAATTELALPEEGGIR